MLFQSRAECMLVGVSCLFSARCRIKRLLTRYLLSHLYHLLLTERFRGGFLASILLLRYALRFTVVSEHCLSVPSGQQFDRRLVHPRHACLVAPIRTR